MSQSSGASIADLTEELTHRIGDLVLSKSGRFSCGGSIPITIQSDGDRTSASASLPREDGPPKAKKAKKTKPTKKSKKSKKAEAADRAPELTPAEPVTIRWDPPSAEPGESRNACFPPSASSAGAGMARLAALLKDCEPATFGRGRKDVLDESYRKASKLDASAFSTDLCPYALGIVDQAAELLMPSVGVGGTRAVEAKLYMLNVYAAPSGHFKPHVDTPRSEQQFGSLVVCLPCPHSGGALVVRHAGHSVTYDWSTTDEDKPAIYWAAFYSDCEHEVLEVTTGHRVTLTYNLFAVPHRTSLKGKTEGLDVTGLPLYRAVKEALDEPEFLPHGGVLGCYCQHWYPHTANSPKHAPIFPSVLKGSDLYLYCVFVALGLEVTIHPVLARDYDEVEERVYDDHDEVYVGDHPCGTGAAETDMGGYDDQAIEEVYAEFGQRETIQWLNAPDASTRQVGFYHLAYGNESTLSSHYTYAALLVTLDRR